MQILSMQSEMMGESNQQFLKRKSKSEIAPVNVLLRYLGGFPFTD